MEKHNSLEGNNLKLKEKLTISESHLPKTSENSSLKPNKSNIKISNFLANTRTPVDSFIDNLVKEKKTLKPHVKQIFKSKEASKQELELSPVDLLRFNGNPVRWLESIDNFYHRIHKKSSFNDILHIDRLMTCLDGGARKPVKTIGTNGIFTL